MLPPDFRGVVESQSPEGSLMLTKFDRCVVGYPMHEWEEIEKKFGQIKNPTRKVRDFMRFFIGGAVEVQLDKQGRVLVPNALRDYAHLEKDVVLVGVGFKFEVWDKGRFDAIEEQDFDDVADDLDGSGVEVSF